MNTIPILMADDDKDDCLLTRDALEEARLNNPIYFVHDGVELLDYLHRRGQYADETVWPTPGLILLDLNMPRLDGRGALAQIKADPQFKHIPVIILTTSGEEGDIQNCYKLGATSFVTKPVVFEDLMKVLTVISEYWFTVVSLPPGKTGGS